MSRPRNSSGVRICRSGYTWIELVVVVVVLAVLLAIGVPALMMAREAARRMTCNANLKQIVMAIHNYGTASKVFPPGTTCSTGPILPQNQYDVWSEAAKSGAAYDGTSFLVRIMRYLSSTAGSLTGGVGLNAGVQGKPGPATNDVYLYCPSRRGTLRPGDSVMMLATWWPGGGTDYGGCVGRHVAYDTSSPSHNVLDAGARNAIVFDPGVTVPNVMYSVSKDGVAQRWGIFGRVNVSTTFGEVRDGLSNTIMTGELQRIAATDAQHGGQNHLSHDGWAIGGDATGFTTGYGGPNVPINGQPTPLMNNGFFQSPGSNHSGGANFGMGDGSVRFLNTSVDPNIFALLGSMADRLPWMPDN
jgi:prepilin-type N-terminal cleavage/methylation domain-containing protein/prepilin-type processing-associated H-X9-DG protein